MPWFQRYRLLFVVVLLAGMSFLWEFADRRSTGAAGGGGPTGLDAYSIARDFQQRQLFDTYAKLYPERPEMLFERGMRARIEGNDPQAREYFEQAIATGFKTREDLYYEYCLVLRRLKAPQNEIDAAVASWKRLFPTSNLQDPSTFSDEELKTARSRILRGVE